MNELKLCPFCSGKGKVSVSNYSASASVARWYFHIRCSNCGVQLPKLYKIEVTLDESGELKFLTDERKNAIDEWNTRNKRGKQ